MSMQRSACLLFFFQLACPPPFDEDAGATAGPPMGGPWSGPPTTSEGSGDPPLCGDGVVQGDEACDDGNLDPADACLNSCRLAACGDGVVQTDVEECDDGNLEGGDACTAACAWATCGDGIVWVGVEACDDADADDADGCTAQCRLGACGDAILQAGEECDDGVDNVPGAWAHAGDCTIACARACGDGVLSVYEACDDGDHLAADGCSDNCEDEHLIFATADVHPADLGGVAAADAACQAAAAAAGLVGTYVAWISSTPEGIDALGDLPVGSPLIRTDGASVVLIAEDLLYKPQFALLHPIDRDEFGQPVTGYAWTGTEISGEASGLDCDGWTDPDADHHAQLGALASTGLSWTAASWVAPAEQVRCTAENHLYCFRAADP